MWNIVLQVAQLLKQLHKANPFYCTNPKIEQLQHNLQLTPQILKKIGLITVISNLQKSKIVQDNNKKSHPNIPIKN